ncbi:MAG: hypothetical protein HY875_06185 [Chloroflexi bacterium]|nr:hypothetical protein [Chloroflexota bacterium]
MTGVLAFWGVSLLTGALALPLAFRLLRRFPDAGAGLSFPLGLALLSYAYFTLRVADVLPAGRAGYLLVFGLFALVSVLLASRDRRFVPTLRRGGPALVMTAGLFTVAFFGYTFFRSYTADISGTEQPMDLMYLNATLESPDYPPDDPWLSGHKASYYYFGYLQTGVLTATAGVPASEGYNLGLAYTFAAAATGVVSLAFALARWVLGGAAQRWAFAASGVSLFLLLFLGSLAGVFELAAAHDRYNTGVYEAFGVDFLLPCAPGVTEDCYRGPTPRSTAWYPTEFWFWFRDTRVIPDTITETPFFSFLLGDLHPHVMSIPLVLLSLGLSASLWRGRGRLDWRRHRRAPFELVAFAVLFGALAFENAWDVLTFTAVFAVAALLRNLRAAPVVDAIAGVVTFVVPVAVLGVAAYVPWYLDFSSQASGFFPYVGEGTRPAHAFLQFGPLLLCAALTLVWAVRRADRGALVSAAAFTAWVPLLPLVLWIVLCAYHGQFGDATEARGTGGWVTLAIYGAVTWALTTALVALARRRSAAALPAGLLALGVLLLLGSELFYIKDVFAGSVPRLNTVFKLSYQAWILLSVGGGPAFVAAIRGAWSGRAPAGWVAAPVAGVLALGGVYAVIAIPNRTDAFNRETSIDGLAFVARSDPDEYALIRWVQDNVPAGTVIVEASGRTWGRDGSGNPTVTNPGSDYSDSGRVSARTGRPTPIGWYFHEVQWRGETAANHAEFSRRQDLVDSAYLAADRATVVRVMAEFGAEYLVAGRIERQRYPGNLLQPFDGVLDLAFESGDLRIYRLPVRDQVGAP